MDPERRAQLIQKREAIRTTRILCEHGVTILTNKWESCAGAVGRCQCCSQSFCYADSGGSDGVTEYMTLWASDLCRTCGGHTTTYERPLPDPWTPWTI